MNKERDYVRSLARQIAELAASPENEIIQKRWRDVNALRKPDRAPVWCSPPGPWADLLPKEALTCADESLRALECDFRMILIKHDIGDDSPVDANFSVGAAFEWDPPNAWGVDVGRHQANVPGGAWKYDPPLKTEADFDKLRIPTSTYNEAKTQEALSRNHDLLGDIMPIKLTCGPSLGNNLCSAAVALRGLEEIMTDMAAQPELVHRLMAHLQKGVLENMRRLEKTGLLTPNNRGPMHCSDPVGPQSPDGKLTFKNLWGGADNQEFDLVSPAMWKEFLLDYQMPILERFGLTSYGCCDDLTHKMDGVLTIPNLRIFVSSAWTNLDKAIERCGDRYVIMWRQKATDVVFPDDVEPIKRHLEAGARKLQGHYYQIVLRELQTLAGHPDRLDVWTKMAIEAAERFA